jgi:peptide/nickel transport system substrate-binding protein
VTLQNDGEPAPEVVTAWKAGTDSYTLTVRKGVTCSDGSAMDAKTVAANINYVGNPKNGSPMTGVAVPAGTTATGDDATSTVHVSLSAGAPFFMQNLAELPLVCQRGLADRKILASASDGSGPYVLSQVIPGNEWTYTVRRGYDWGPNGASTAVRGMPAKIIFKLVSDNTTAATLLLSGQLNVGPVTGSIQQRLGGAGLFSAGGLTMNDELTFNTASPGLGDVQVRRALVEDLDLPQIVEVDQGVAPDGLMAPPKICGGNTMTGNVPAYSPAGARQLLDEVGWKAGPGGVRTKNGAKLSVSIIFDNSVPTTGPATAQYIYAQWKQLGVDVTLDQVSFNQQASVVFSGTGAWGAALISLGVSNPATLVPFFSGPTPPKGENFGHVTGAYGQLVQEASGKPGTAGCPDWNAAEATLFRDANIIPLSDLRTLYWGNGARFDVWAGVLIPTSLRAVSR